MAMIFAFGPFRLDAEAETLSVLNRSRLAKACCGPVAGAFRSPCITGYGSSPDAGRTLFRSDPRPPASDAILSHVMWP
jgi:hypothetical protein